MRKTTWEEKKNEEENKIKIMQHYVTLARKHAPPKLFCLLVHDDCKMFENEAKRTLKFILRHTNTQKYYYLSNVGCLESLLSY